VARKFDSYVASLKGHACSNKCAAITARSVGDERWRADEKDITNAESEICMLRVQIQRPSLTLEGGPAQLGILYFLGRENERRCADPCLGVVGQVHSASLSGLERSRPSPSLLSECCHPGNVYLGGRGEGRRRRRSGGQTSGGGAEALQGRAELAEDGLEALRVDAVGRDTVQRGQLKVCARGGRSACTPQCGHMQGTPKQRGSHSLCAQFRGTL